MAAKEKEVPDIVEVLKLMAERNEERMKLEDERRKEEELKRSVEAELRRADEEGRRLELREMFGQMTEVDRDRAERRRMRDIRQRKRPGRKEWKKMKEMRRKGRWRNCWVWVWLRSQWIWGCILKG